MLRPRAVTTRSSHSGMTSAPMLSPVRLGEVLLENVLKLFHDVVHVDGDQAAVLLQRLFKNTLK